MINYDKLIQKVKDGFQDFIEFSKEYNEDWHYWSNNKRKRHGYPMRRKPFKNIKTSVWNKWKSKAKFFLLLEDTLDKYISKTLEENEWFANFVDYKNFPIGDISPLELDDKYKTYIIPTVKDFKPIKIILKENNNV